METHAPGGIQVRDPSEQPQTLFIGRIQASAVCCIVAE
jgi:hypothetical protein